MRFVLQMLFYFEVLCLCLNASMAISVLHDNKQSRYTPQQLYCCYSKTVQKSMLFRSNWWQLLRTYDLITTSTHICDHPYHPEIILRFQLHKYPGIWLLLGHLFYLGGAIFSSVDLFLTWWRYFLPSGAIFSSVELCLTWWRYLLLSGATLSSVELLLARWSYFLFTLHNKLSYNQNWCNHIYSLQFVVLEAHFLSFTLLVIRTLVQQMSFVGNGFAFVYAFCRKLC